MKKTNIKLIIAIIISLLLMAIDNFFIVFGAMLVILFCSIILIYIFLNYLFLSKKRYKDFCDRWNYENTAEDIERIRRHQENEEIIRLLNEIKNKK